VPPPKQCYIPNIPEDHSLAVCYFENTKSHIWLNCKFVLYFLTVMVEKWENAVRVEFNIIMQGKCECWGRLVLKGWRCRGTLALRKHTGNKARPIYHYHISSYVHTQSYFKYSATVISNTMNMSITDPFSRCLFMCLYLALNYFWDSVMNYLVLEYWQHRTQWYHRICNKKEVPVSKL
jgi:hypothetical protein